MKRIFKFSAVFLSFLFLLSLIACGGEGGGGGGGGGAPPPSVSSNAALASLTLSNGVMNPSFDPSTTAYTSMFIGQPSITISPTAADARAKITVNGTGVASGQPSQAISLNPGPNAVTVVVTATDGVTTKTYTITANLLSQEAYVKASNAGGSDGFGYSVSLSGDTLAVGAYWEYSNATGINGNEADNSAPFSGAVYVFTRAGTTWTQQAYIKASNTDWWDRFGSSVSLSGGTLAVGAPGEDSNATDSGAVYLLR